MAGPIKRAISRREEYSTATRRALLDSATELFTDRGFTGTSLDEVVAAARVTKGALYHHYRGKLALFQAVFEQVEDDAAAKISADVRKAQDPWQKPLAGVRSFLQVCQEPAYRRIVMQEGPVALGYEQWRESEERTTFGLIRGIVAEVMQQYDIGEDMLEAFTRLFFGAMSSAALTVSEAEDPERARREVETVIALMLAGLRQLAESGLDLSEPLPDARVLFEAGDEGG